RKELVQLRRLDRRPGKHRVCLSAMVDLMLEYMHEEAVAPFSLHPVVAIDPHAAIEESGCQCIADRNQTLVDRRLSALQFNGRRARDRILPGFWPEPTALQRVDVKQVDDVNVIQGLLQARKEAGSARFKVRLIEIDASSEQSMICPRIIV